MKRKHKKVLMLASVASMIDQFNMPNICLLQEMGYEVHAACNFQEGNTCDAQQLLDLKKRLAAMQVKWYQWGCPRNFASVKKCWMAYRDLIRILKRESYAWIHCHSPIGGAIARIAAKRQGIRVLYTAHGFHFYDGAPLKNWLLYFPAERLLAKWTDVLITVNQEDYKIARRRLKAGKVCYIPGVGIDTEKFALGLREQGECRDKDFCRKFDIPPNAVVLLSVGELSRRKNHQMVIAALAALQRRNVYYLICGQGALYGELMRYADSLGVSTYVRMPGYQSRMPWICQNADIFVFPSVQEGMPVALMEAMASGMPCIVSDIRGNQELIRSRERFSPDDPEKLLRLLKRMLDDQQYRLKCGMYNRAQIQTYRYAAVEARMKKIYREV